MNMSRKTCYKNEHKFWIFFNMSDQIVWSEYTSSHIASSASKIETLDPCQKIHEA